jgi:hypothetical protein
MTRLMMLNLIFLVSILSGCAAIQGAQGDAAAKQATPQTSAAQNSAGTTINTGTVTSPVQARTPAQGAQTNAAKMIAPLTH